MVSHFKVPGRPSVGAALDVRSTSPTNEGINSVATIATFDYLPQCEGLLRGDPGARIRRNASKREDGSKYGSKAAQSQLSCDVPIRREHGRGFQLRGSCPESLSASWGPALEDPVEEGFTANTCSHVADFWCGHSRTFGQNLSRWERFELSTGKI